jgi:hypothetical protein
MSRCLIRQLVGARPVESSTDSGGNGVHARALAETFVLQIGHSECVGSARACLRVLRLTYQSCTRGALSVLKTHDGTGRRFEQHG